MLIVRSKEKAAEKYPDSLGEYRRLKDKYHNGYPVFQNLAKDKRYIIRISNNSDPIHSPSNLISINN